MQIPRPLNMLQNILLRNILLLAVVFTISGCADGELTAMIRKVTYPPDFKYVTGAELRSNMNKMAYQVQLLDSALIANEATPESQQKKVLDALKKIEKISSSLQAGDAGSTHPFLQDYMPYFVSGVSLARHNASLNPPDYYLAGRITGGCVNCHKVNRRTIH